MVTGVSYNVTFLMVLIVGLMWLFGVVTQSHRALAISIVVKTAFWRYVTGQNTVVIKATAGDNKTECLLGRLTMFWSCYGSSVSYVLTIKTT